MTGSAHSVTTSDHKPVCLSSAFRRHSPSKGCLGFKQKENAAIDCLIKWMCSQQSRMHWGLSHSHLHLKMVGRGELQSSSSKGMVLAPGGELWGDRAQIHGFCFTGQSLTIRLGMRSTLFFLAEIGTLCNLNLRSMSSERQQWADLELVAQLSVVSASEAGIRFQIFSINTLLLSFDLLLHERERIFSSAVSLWERPKSTLSETGLKWRASAKL